jgi:hypothetical protein
MKLRLWILLALAAVALLASGTPVFHDSGPKAKAVSAVFDTVVKQRYPQWTSAYSECLASPQPNHDVCWAEIHKGARYLQVEIGIDLTTSSPVPSAATLHRAWTRKPIRVAYVPGAGVANSPAYEWQTLMRNVATVPTSALAVDDAAGYATGLFTFKCTGTQTKVSCRNSAGDSLTYDRSR